MELLTLCDSISVKILSEKVLLAGVGNEVRVYTEGSDTFSTLQWKLQNKIHGLDVNGKEILVYGGREFMILHYDEEITFICKGNLSDWISSGKLLKDRVNRICLVTGHSVAVGLSIRGSSIKPSIEARSSCSDKSTIYTSTIVENTSSHCTVFAGTAFGELLIWKPDLEKRNVEFKSRQPILHRIASHNGVIFSIDFHDTYNIITTTSDDRSVRFYSISSKNDAEKQIDWSNATIKPIRSVYGHNARVFKAKIIENENIPYVISAGEDSFICIWHLNGELLFKRHHHFGATIWNFDYDSKAKILFSSSSDGNVISDSLADHFLPVKILEVKSNCLPGEYLAKIRFVRKNFLVAVTNRNRLVYRKNSDWKVVNDFSAYKCTLLEVSKQLIATTGYKVLTLFQVDGADIVKVWERAVVSSVIRSFCFLSDTEMLVCDEKGECKYSADNFENSININLPIAKEPWITSALKHELFLVLSNRQGNLLLYKRNNDCFDLKFTLKHVHGYLGITDMCLKQDTNDYLLIRSAGHDSTIKTLKVDKALCSVTVALTENIPVAWVETLIGDYAVGFNDNHFVVCKLTQDVIFQVSCGGGHRYWDILLDETSNSLELIYIKNKVLYTTVATLNSNISNKYKICYYSWHKKSCNILDLVNVNDNELLLVSGGEDNLLKYSRFSICKPNAIKLIQNIYLHVSSIKHIKVVKNGHKLIIFSVGGRAQICVTEYDKKTDGVQEISQFMLKSSDFDRKYQRNTQKVDFDPETRFMNIATVNEGEGYTLYLGCSDGFIRQFSYEKGIIKLVGTVSYSRCILHTKIIFVAGEGFLITAATDGWLCLWKLKNFNTTKEPIFKIRHHESGVNSLDINVISNKIITATGGDDQNVVVSEIMLENSKFEIKLKNTFHVHTAQVNGVRISECSKLLFTTSIDQTICQINLKNMSFEKRRTMSIADVKGLSLCNLNGEHYCIVYGWGVQICKV